jgi:hypothetical protein
MSDYKNDQELEAMFSSLDKGIERAVRVLMKAGIETFESCEGSAGHAYLEPTVRFHGDRFEGFKAFAAAKQHGLKVYALRRIWTMRDDEPTGPYWEMTFRNTAPSGG